MASLRDTLRKKTGGLAETSLEELSQQAGRPIPPTTPAGAMGIGANPDQAKMVGTQNYLRNAIRAGAEAPQDLATVQRRQQVRSTQTSAEQEAAKKAEQLKGLGSLQSRVQDLAEQKLYQGAQQAQVGLQTAGQEDPETVGLLNQLSQDPTNQDAMLALNRKLGRDATNILTGPELLSMYKGAAEGDRAAVIAEAMGQPLENATATGGLNLEDVGGIDNLSQLLGIPKDQLQAMPLSDLLDNINNVINQDYSQVEDLQRVVNDPTVGTADRAAARQQLRELGASGVAGFESDLDQLADQLMGADTINIMGKEMTIEDALGNDYLSGLAKQYFEQPDFAEEMRNDPEMADLAKLFDTHAQTLAAAADKLDDSYTQFADQVKSNLDIGKTKGGNVEESVLKELIPNYGALTTEEYQQPGALTLLKNPTVSEEQKTSLVKALNNIQKDLPNLGPQVLQGLRAMSEDEVRALGLLDPNSDEYKHFKEYYNTAERVKNLQNTGKWNSDAAASLLGFTSFDDFNKSMPWVNEAIKNGIVDDIPGLKGVKDILFTPDGALNTKHLAKALGARFSTISAPKDLVKGRVPSQYVTVGQEVKKKLEEIQNDPALRVLRKYYDGDLTPERVVSDVRHNRWKPEELTAVYNNSELLNKVSDNNADKIRSSIRWELGNKQGDQITKDLIAQIPKKERTLDGEAIPPSLNSLEPLIAEITAKPQGPYRDLQVEILNGLKTKRERYNKRIAEAEAETKRKIAAKAKKKAQAHANENKKKLEDKKNENIMAQASRELSANKIKSKLQSGAKQKEDAVARTVGKSVSTLKDLVKDPEKTVKKVWNSLWGKD